MRLHSTVYVNITVQLIHLGVQLDAVDIGHDWIKYFPKNFPLEPSLIWLYHCPTPYKIQRNPSGFLFNCHEGCLNIKLGTVSDINIISVWKKLNTSFCLYRARLITCLMQTNHPYNSPSKYWGAYKTASHLNRADGIADIPSSEMAIWMGTIFSILMNFSSREKDYMYQSDLRLF